MAGIGSVGIWTDSMIYFIQSDAIRATVSSEFEIPAPLSERVIYRNVVIWPWIIEWINNEYNWITSEMSVNNIHQPLMVP